MIPFFLRCRGLSLALIVTLALGTGCSDYEAARRAFVAGKHDEAFSGMLKLAQAGDPRAQYDVAMMYVQGIGVAKDREVGFGWMIQAGTSGNIGAMNELGAIYESGIGASRNFAVAFQWYRMAAQADNPIGQFNIANMYARGIGVSPDLVRAWAWNMRAGANGTLTGKDRANQLEEKMSAKELADAKVLERQLAQNPSND